MDNPIPHARNRLQGERQRRGWSRKYVAEQLDVSEYTIGQWGTPSGLHTILNDAIKLLVVEYNDVSYGKHVYKAFHLQGVPAWA